MTRNAILLVLMVAVMCTYTTTSTAQPPPLGELVTNAEIQPDAELTLLVLHGGKEDRAALQLSTLFSEPKTQALAGWMESLNVKFTNADSPLAKAHGDLLGKHQTLPIVALVQAPGTQGEGAVWWSTSPPQLQLDETWLSSQLATYVAATLEARARAGRSDLNAMPPSWITDQRPEPFVPRPRRPIINPQINHDVNVPDAIATNVDAGTRTEQMLTRLAIIIGGAWLLSAIVGAWGRLSAARTMADAETMDPDDYQRLYNPPMNADEANAQ